MTTVHQRFIEHLISSGIPFEEIEHPPVAAAEEYSRAVGSSLDKQAKALLLRRYRRSGGKDLVVHSLPGDQRGDLGVLTEPLDAKRLRLATASELKAATGCDFGELPSIGSIFGLPLSMDERLLGHDKIFIGAGRLDRSVILSPDDFRRHEVPIIVPIT